MTKRCALFMLSFVLTETACILPDTGIQVYSVQECGFQYIGSTANATGVTGAGNVKEIKSTSEEWILVYWCLSPEQSVLMQYENSLLYLELLHDVIEACQLRAIELEMGQDNCSQVAVVAYSGECPGELEWCDAGTSDDEVGVELDLPN